jgi:hypothetical protein
VKSLICRSRPSPLDTVCRPVHSALLSHLSGAYFWSLGKYPLRVITGYFASLGQEGQQVQEGQKRQKGHVDYQAVPGNPGNCLRRVVRMERETTFLKLRANA